ncbi:MAG: alpha/beta fold hydrolase, partial [Nitrospirota bacterium]|nr:alpha/beta fold hydrolase [Nitrospirota bacterium]
VVVALFCLCALAACAGGQAEVPPVVVEGPSQAEIQQAEAKKQRLMLAEVERRASEQELARRARESYGGDIPDYAVGRVLYATDRRASPKEDAGEFYGGDRGLPQMGLCTVGVARDRRVGTLDVHTLVKPTPAGDFYLQLQDRLAEAGSHDLLIFVHGYNSTFDDAVRRTAQLAYDLGFPGLPIVYSWPSQGSLGSYLVDETNVEWATPHVREFLMQVAAKSGAQAIHVIAHSMGARAVMAALQQIAQHPQGDLTSRFKEVVLLAPDMDADVFINQVQGIHRVVERVTLYASAKDKALVWSKSAHGYPRAGDARPSLVVVPGVDTIDASWVDTSFTGHSYYADSRSVLFDLFNLLRHGKPPGERFGLLAKEQNGQRYWAFQPY